MTTTAQVERLCSKPGCGKSGVHLCSGCGEESYCSKECQKEHWVDHKLACKLAVKPETAAMLQSFDSLSIKQLKNLIKAKAATMDAKKRAIILGQLENIVEKNNLLWLVKQHVQPTEIEVLLTNNPPSMQPSQVEIPASGGKGGGAGMKRKLQSKKSDQGNMNGQTPSPQQLREQASMMRKNPELVRKSNPAFLKMSNAQIMAYADHLEKAASDPSMMKEIEKMSKLSNTERDQIQQLQEGLSGSREMDDVWIANAVKTLKSNPELIKSMFRGRGEMLGGISDSQIEGFIDGASKMDATMLKFIIRVLKYLGSLAKPASDIYNKVNQYTFGQANAILSVLVLMLLSIGGYFTYRVLAFVFGWIWKMIFSTAAVTSNVSSKVTPAASSTVADIVEVASASVAAGATAKTVASEIAKEIGKDASKKAESMDAEFEF